jgi:hypothetical protein
MRRAYQAWTRVLLFVAVVAAMWTLALPALAAPAPYCDDRGASALAPPPTLQLPEQGVAPTLLAPPACPLDETTLLPALSADRTVHSSLSSAEPAMPVALQWLSPASTGMLPEVAPVAVVSSWIRWRVERPPRG